MSNNDLLKQIKERAAVKKQADQSNHNESIVQPKRVKPKAESVQQPKKSDAVKTDEKPSQMRNIPQNVADIPKSEVLVEKQQYETRRVDPERVKVENNKQINGLNNSLDLNDGLKVSDGKLSDINVSKHKRVDSKKDITVSAGSDVENSYLSMDNLMKRVYASKSDPFGDLFVPSSDGEIYYNENHKKISVRDIPWAILDRSINDLKDRYLGVAVTIGSKIYRVLSSNSVFSVNRTAIRFFTLNSMSDSFEKIKIARDLFLNKYPNGESPVFNPELAKTDELDIYIMILATASAPKLSVEDRLKVLQQNVDEIKQKENQVYSVLKSHDSIEQKRMFGLLHGMSYLLLDRMGLTPSTLPDSITEVPRKMSDDDFTKIADMLVDIFGEGYSSRFDTMRRDKRVRRK